MRKRDLDENVFGLLESERARCVRLLEALQDEIERSAASGMDQDQAARRDELQKDLLAYEKRIRTLEYLIKKGDMEAIMCDQFSKQEGKSLEYYRELENKFEQLIDIIGENYPEDHKFKRVLGPYSDEQEDHAEVKSILSELWDINEPKYGNNPSKWPVLDRAVYLLMMSKAEVYREIYRIHEEDNPFAPKG